MFFRMIIFFVKDRELEVLKDTSEHEIERCKNREKNKRRLKRIEGEIERRIRVQQPNENWSELSEMEVRNKYTAYCHNWTGYNTRDAYEMRKRLGYKRS